MGDSVPDGGPGEGPEKGPKEQERLSALLGEHLPGLRGYLNKHASSLLLARESAEDLAQSACREVVRQVQEGRLELRSDAEFKQWLYQAGLHKLQDRAKYHLAGKRDLRREVRQVAPLDSEDAGFEPASSATPSRFCRHLGSSGASAPGDR